MSPKGQLSVEDLRNIIQDIGTLRIPADIGAKEKIKYN